jgi:hypothetical protein
MSGGGADELDGLPLEFLSDCGHLTGLTASHDGLGVSIHV